MTGEKRKEMLDILKTHLHLYKLNAQEVQIATDNLHKPYATETAKRDQKERESALDTARADLDMTQERIFGFVEGLTVLLP